MFRAVINMGLYRRNMSLDRICRTTSLALAREPTERTELPLSDSKNKIIFPIALQSPIDRSMAAQSRHLRALPCSVWPLVICSQPYVPHSLSTFTTWQILQSLGSAGESGSLLDNSCCSAPSDIFQAKATCQIKSKPADKGLNTECARFCGSRRLGRPKGRWTMARLQLIQAHL